MIILIVLAILALIVLAIILIFVSKYKVSSLSDEMKKVRNDTSEITRDYLNLSDGTSLKLLQNDPWETKAIVIGVPSMLSTRKEFSDLSLFFEEQDTKFFCSNIRHQGWDGNCNKINLGTSLVDIKELIKEVRRIYPDKKIFLLGQSFGANMAYYLSKQKNSKVDGIIIANPLISNSKINYWNFTQYSFFIETIKIKNELQFIDLRKSSVFLKQKTNNSSYLKEIIDLWERRYHHGISIKYIAQAESLITYFKRNEGYIKDDKSLFLHSTDFKQPYDYHCKNISSVGGNELVLTDYLNEDSLELIRLFILNKQNI